MTNDAYIQSLSTIGQQVFFWSGRGSQGYGTIREIRDGRAFIDPDPDAIKGSDYRLFRQPAKRYDVWVPRDYGVRFAQLNTRQGRGFRTTEPPRARSLA